MIITILNSRSHRKYCPDGVHIIYIWVTMVTQHTHRSNEWFSCCCTVFCRVVDRVVAKVSTDILLLASKVRAVFSSCCDSCCTNCSSAAAACVCVGDLLNNVTPPGLHMILQYYTPHFTKLLTLTSSLLETIINLLTHCLT